MKKIINILIPIVVVLILFVISFFYYQSKKVEETNKIKIGTTIGALASILREIGGNKIEVVDLSEGALHAHEIILSPQKLEKIKGSKIIFSIGFNLDEWVEKLEREYRIPIYKFEKDVEVLKFDKKNVNAHYWLSLKNSKIIATKITSKLTEIDPKNAIYYKKQLQNFFQGVDELEKLSKNFKNLKNNKIIVTHPAFDYLAKELGLEIIGYLKTEEGEGISADQLIDLALKIKKYNIKSIFVEKGFIDQAVLQFAKIYSLKIIELDPLEIASPEQIFTVTLKENIEKIYNNL